MLRWVPHVRVITCAYGAGDNSKRVTVSDSNAVSRYSVELDAPSALRAAHKLLIYTSKGVLLFSVYYIIIIIITMYSVTN